MTQGWGQHQPRCATPPQPCWHCSFISVCVNDGRSQLLIPHPFYSPLPLHQHAQQVVLTRDLLHSSLPSLLACVYQLATSATMHMQFYRLFGNTLSRKGFIQSFSLPIMEHRSKESDFYLHSFHTTRALQLFWRPVPTSPATTAPLNLDLTLSTLLPLHLTYAMEKKGQYLSVSCLWWKPSQRRPRWPDSKLNRRNRQPCIWNDVLDGLSRSNKN